MLRTLVKPALAVSLCLLCRSAPCLTVDGLTLSFEENEFGMGVLRMGLAKTTEADSYTVVLSFSSKENESPRDEIVFNVGADGLKSYSNRVMLPLEKYKGGFYVIVVNGGATVGRGGTANVFSLKGNRSKHVDGSLLWDQAAPVLKEARMAAEQGTRPDAEPSDGNLVDPELLKEVE